MAQKDEIRNRRVGAAVSLGIHLALLILFLFIIAWKEPIPPIPQYGIEINFGLDQAGSGAEQPQSAPLESPVEETETEARKSEPVEEVLEEEVMEETSDEQVPVEEMESPQEPQPEKVVTQPIESDVQVEKTDQPSPSPETPQEFSENTQTTLPEGTLSDNQQPSQANQGDKEDEIGDQGDPQGQLDARALYGEPGGGGGASLQLTGWDWGHFIPRRDPSDQNGKLVFQIVIDDEGEILSIKKLESSVSPEVVKFYKDQVAKLTFHRTSDNTIVAPTSKGIITFIIRSR